MTDLSVAHKLSPYKPKNKVRFVTAAALFDGHDASINIMRRILQSNGVEVIHLGHNRSVDDVVTAAGVTRLDGRTAVDSPENLAKLEFGYDDSKLFARIGVSHVGERFYTYTNDASVGSYTILDLSGGYRFGSFGVLKNLTAQFNVTNLADEEYVSTIGSNGFTNTDATGTGQTVLAGAPRQFFLTVNASF